MCSGASVLNVVITLTDAKILVIASDIMWGEVDHVGTELLAQVAIWEVKKRRCRCSDMVTDRWKLCC